MKSATSSSKSWFYPTLWKKNMTRFWPIWAVYLACWVFTMPLLLLTEYGSNIGSMDGKQYFAAQVVRDWCTWPALLAGTVFGILSAMAVFSYLYNNRSAGMLHALPVRREGLFLTNYLSGLSFMVLPQLLVFVLTLLAEAVVGCVDALALGQWLLVQICVTLFFYSFAVFCAMFTGHILALPVFYGILNGLAAGLYWLVNGLFRDLVFGYNGSNGMGEAVLWLTPAGKLGSELNVDVLWSEAGNLDRVVLYGIGYALLYALLGLVLAALALVLYRRRHLEGAGDVVTVRWVRPIFKYGVAFCAALALGTLLYGWFGWNPGRDGIWGLLAFLLIFGAAGYFAAEMLLKKSFRVLDAWRGCAVFSAALVALALGVRFDVVGYERRVPDPAQVMGVEIMDVYSAPEDSARYYGIGTGRDPDFIRAVTELQQSIVDRREEYRGIVGFGSYEPGVVDGLEVDSIQTEGTKSLRIDYTMPSGNRVSRSYQIPVRAGDLSDPDSPAARLTALLNRTEDRVEMYFPKTLDGKRLMDVSVTSWERNGDTEPVSIPQSRQQDLLDAVKADLAAGRLGIRYLLDDADRLSNCYVNDLEFTFQETASSAGSRGGVPQTMPADVAVGVSYSTVSVTLQATATETMALLRELGMEDQVKLITQAQRQHQYWLEDRQEDALKEGADYAEAERAYLG